MAPAKSLFTPLKSQFSRVKSLFSPVSYTYLRAHETESYIVCRLMLEKKKNKAQMCYRH